MQKSISIFFHEKMYFAHLSLDEPLKVRYYGGRKDDHTKALLLQHCQNREEFCSQWLDLERERAGPLTVRLFLFALFLMLHGLFLLHRYKVHTTQKTKGINLC